MRPTRSLPAEAERRGQRLRLPIWSCSGWGLPSGGAFATTRWSLTPPFHPYHRPKPLAVCFCGTFHRRRYSSAFPAFTTEHPALRSPDFPPVQRFPTHERSVTPRRPVEKKIAAAFQPPTMPCKEYARTSDMFQHWHYVAPNAPFAAAGSGGTHRKPSPPQAGQPRASDGSTVGCRSTTPEAK